MAFLQEAPAEAENMTARFVNIHSLGRCTIQQSNSSQTAGLEATSSRLMVQGNNSAL